MACLLSAAEKKGLVMMARIAVVQALQAGTPAPMAGRREKGGPKIPDPLLRPALNAPA